MKPLSLARLLLVTTALGAVPAHAQSSSAGPTAAPRVAPPDPARADPRVEPQEQVEISSPGATVASPASEEDIVVVGRYIPDVVRSTPEVVSVLSAADIARTGEGDIAGALQRVTGLSVVSGGFVYVRGLGDRYSLALLNGSPLPSPEPLRRVVPLDIFPTSVLASSLVQKSYSVNYPGEFGGGVINLTTRAVPDVPFLSFGTSISGNSETTGQLGYTYYGSPTDWTGFDNGTRDTPGPLRSALNSGNLISEGANFSRRQIQDIGASLVNSRTSVVQRNRNIMPNFSADLSAGKSWDLPDGKIGVILAAGYNNSWRTRDAIQQLSAGFVGDQLLPDLDFRSVGTDNRIVVNGLFGLGIESGDHKLRWTNLYIRDTVKRAEIARGTDAISLDGTTPVLTQQTYWFERQLIDTQLVGELRFGDLSVDLRGTYANSQREAPYEREFSYVYDDTVQDFVNNLRATSQNARIAFSDLNENVYHGAIDTAYKLPIAMPVTLSAGYYFSDTARDSVRREFRFNPVDELPGFVAQQRPDALLSDYNIYAYNILLTETSGQTGAAAYDADLRIHAGYGQVEVQPVPQVKVSAGVRYEDARQRVTPTDLFGQGASQINATRLDNSYWLPAATITWNFLPDMQLRLNASKTIARPQFRELAFQLYQDNESDRQFFGNPFLVDSRLTNAEARYEYYFGRGERFSLAGFYKKLKNPIEAFAFRSSGSLQTSFANAPEAELYGAEIETQKYIPATDLFGGEFWDTRRFVLIGNYTWSESKIRVGADDTVVFATGSVQPAADFFRNGAPLTGQSKHLANVQLGLEDTERVSQQTVLLTYASQRVTNRGPAGSPQQPDIIEKPGIRLDFVAREEAEFLGRTVEIKFEARNLTNTRFQEFQTANGSRIDINSYDIGTTISLGVGVRF